MNLHIISRFAVIIVSITYLFVGCSTQPLKRSTYNGSNKMNCENQDKYENRASSVRAYDQKYDQYQRSREEYLRERQEAICR